MKKQILFLTMFTLALFFAGTKSYGQDINYLNVGTTDCPVPAVLNCSSVDGGELNPLPGQTYTYTVAVDPAVVAPGYINWFITDDATIIDATGIIAVIEPDGGASPYLLDAEDGVYNNIATPNTDVSIDISWKSFDGTAHQVLLVAYVKGNGTPGCSDNIQVWRIEPNFAFRLEIAGMLPDGTVPAAGNASECLTPVQSAIYDGTNLSMDYGDNYVYFVVSAASFVDSWQPTFAVTSTSTPVTPIALTDIQWAYPNQAILNAAGVATGIWNATNIPVEAQDPSNSVGDAGECIIVRVHVDHNAIENADPSSVILGVDGIMVDLSNGSYTNTDLADLDNGATPADPCVVGSNDSATYDFTPRPDITEVNPTTVLGPFEPKN